MDVCSHSVLSVPEIICSFHKLPVDSLESTRIVMVESSFDDTEKSLAEQLSIHEDLEFDSAPATPSARPEDATSDIEPNPYQVNTSTSEKCLSKSATFPSVARNEERRLKVEATDTTSEFSKHNDDAKSVTPSNLRAISLPQNARKIVSAMKGSREKQGVPPMKLAVKWAPDVYDPTPTAASHVVTNKPHRHNKKKNSKNKQKTVGGKNTRGSKSKDKKQGRKHSGNSSRGSKMMMDYDEEKGVEFDEPSQPSVSDFNVGNDSAGDHYCGTSFLSKSVTSLRFSVAEAT